MALGFVLISASPGREHDVYNALLKVNDIVELHPLFGEYDMIAKVEAPDFDALGLSSSSASGPLRAWSTPTLTGTKF